MPVNDAPTPPAPVTVDEAERVAALICPNLSPQASAEVSAVVQSLARQLAETLLEQERAAVAELRAEIAALRQPDGLVTVPPDNGHVTEPVT